METTFAECLKKLIKFTNTKLNALAYFIGYDISYISKWSNNASRPSAKYIRRINSMLAQFFTEAILEKHSEYLFLREFGIKEPLPASEANIFLTEQINNMLNNAYYIKQQTPTPTSAFIDLDNPSPVSTIIGRSKIYEFFCYKIAPQISELNEGNDIFFTIDIFTLMEQNKFLSFLDRCSLSQKRFNIYIGCDTELLKNRTESEIYKLYEFLNKYFYVNFYIYENTLFRYSNIFLVKDKFAIQYSLHEDRSIDVCTYIQHTASVNELYNRISEKFFNSVPMLRPKKELAFVNFRSFFYLNNNFVLFVANGFEFFLSANSFDRLIEACNKANYPPEVAKSIKNLQITWEEQFEKSPITFIIPQYNLMNYVQSGKLIYGGIKYKTSVEERQKQIERLITAMKNNSLINIYVINRQEVLNAEMYYKLSYYSNTKMAYFKKNKYLLRDRDKAIYLVKNKLLIEKFDSLFKQLKNAPYSTPYTVEEIESLYQNNIALLQRMMQRV